MSPICVGRQQKLFFFSQLHTVVKLVLNTITIFETKQRYQLHPEDDIRCALTTTKLFSTNLWNKFRDKILTEICEIGRWIEFAKTSVCIILVVLAYRESVKIYTGPKILRVLKRLRNTVIKIRDLWEYVFFVKV